MSRKQDKPSSSSSLLDELVVETPELLARLDNRETQEQGAMPQLPMADIFPDPNQPRKQIRQETLRLLAEDITRHGVLQPIVVRPASDWHGFLLVFGERRFRAAQIAGLTHIPATIRRDLTEVQILELQWQENAQREDIDEIDKALHLRRFKEAAGLSWTQLAERMRLTRRHLIRMQQIAEMPQSVCDLLREHRLSASHIYQLARLQDNDKEIFANSAAEERWSVRVLDEKIQRHLGTSKDEATTEEAVFFNEILSRLRLRLTSAVPISDIERDALCKIGQTASEFLSK